METHIEGAAVKWDHIEQEEVSAIVSRIQDAANSNWVIGEQAHLAKQNYGVTDETLAEMTGIDVGLLRQCRLVWVRFGEHYSSNAPSWTHHRTAISWEDAEHWLQLASDTGLSVKEMQKARILTMDADTIATDSSGEQQGDTETAESTEAPKRRGPKKSKATPAPETANKKKGAGKKAEREKQPQLESAKETGKPPGGVNFNPPDWEERKDDEPDIEGFVSKFDETVQRVRTEEQRQELISKVRARLELLERPGKTAVESILQEFPGLAQNERFASVFRDWLKMRRRERWTVKEDYIRHTLRRLSDGTGTAAIDSLQNSIDQRWRGVFINEKGKGGKSERIRIDGGESEEWVPDEDFTVET